MLRTLVRQAFWVVAPPTVREHRIGGTPAARPHRGVAVEERRTEPRILYAPWGESPGLARIAVVTTEAFPPEWWRRPRTDDIPESPFLADQQPARAVAIAPMPEAVKADRVATDAATHGNVATTTPATRIRARRPATADGCSRGSAVVLAGAIISFIVVDAANGRGRSR